MATFITGLVILLLGGYLYGKFVEHVFKPDDRETPAVRMKDGIDYVPMNKWKNALINLLNIAGTGPIFGPIQGILFGPIAFITIPIGCVISGATHDYLSGMMSLRQNGAQMPGIIRKFWEIKLIKCTIFSLFSDASCGCSVHLYSRRSVCRANLRISGCQCMDMGNLRSDLALLSGGHVVPD